MIFIWGERVLGTVDRIPGVCHVATVFFCIYYFPIYPFRSYIVLEGTSSEIEDVSRRVAIQATRYDFWGIPIPMSLRSVLVGYVRAVLVATFLFGLLIATVLIANAIQGDVQKGFDPFGPFAGFGYGLMIVSGASYWASRRLTRPSEARTRELLDSLNGPSGASSYLA